MNIEGIEMEVRRRGDICSDAIDFLRRHNHEKTAEHSIRVKKAAEGLAKRFHVSVQKAEIAGVLHDISGVIPNEKRLAAAEALGIDILPEERVFPMIIHQKLSKVMARDLFQVADQDILNAIECHTTLRKNPSPLDLVVFSADKIEWDQTGTPPYIKELHEALDVSLENGAFIYIQYLWKQKDKLKVVHPWLKDAYHNLKAKIEASPRQNDRPSDV
ncbi:MULTISPECIES: bis(5'-nucleosyl)-tetraphosphatase (symmetrical) YqeK [Bacillus]|uniref:bis(5'-nucleosyl)-tetraphosphatase (symmetrical) YqeK n=1 Tax=Bacillus TaxID=1386 RepID=UPI00041C1CDE|nr:MULTISPECIES: bis(5'-nucleosyl)-tetraphosphatase (symmetrical) YqeK [Bacillus]QHZ47216.1 HD domain-containing protein [Bacillus sp. NSP9.1]WFA07280.1 bis(5'-nucleosyl)-tetraphosphatase (symmetrical) YqeK [Bacillus sp. HSf4]